MHSECFAELSAQSDELIREHAEAMRELAHMGLQAIETAYALLSERAAIPNASLNICDAFKKLLDVIPKRTSWVAHAMNVQQTDSKRSALTLWLDWFHTRAASTT